MFLNVKTITKLNLGQGEKFEIKTNIKISRRGSRSPDNEKLGPFTLLGSLSKPRRQQEHR